jgi:hypothetical protein
MAPLFSIARPWLHKARQMPKEEFKQEVEKELTGRETEPWEIVYFKLYQSQIPVIERAIETAAPMLGSDRSRGYCLEMICADFLAGANLRPRRSRFAAVFDDEVLQIPARRAAAGISWRPQRRGIMSPMRPDPPGLRLDSVSYERLRQQVLRRDGWRCQSCGAMSNLEVHHKEFRSHSGHDSDENLITLCTPCHAYVHHH